MATGIQPSSAFIRRLNQISSGAPARIGFRATQGEVDRALLIVVKLPGPEPGLAEAAAKGGAGAIQVRIDALDEADEASMLQGLVKAAGGVPVGVLLTGDSKASLQRVESWQSAGVDFIVIGVDSDAAYLRAAGLGRILLVDHSTKSEVIRSVNDLPLDAVEASLATPEEIGQPLSVRDVLRYRALSMAVHKPIIVESDRQIEPVDIAALRDARVEALVIDARQTGTDRDSIQTATARFVQAVKDLGAAPGRAATGMVATLPRTSTGQAAPEGPEDEPEEE